jgi:hypothetical protein
MMLTGLFDSSFYSSSMSAFNFEKFTQIGRRYAAQVSIRSNGAIGISQGAIHQAGMAEGDDWHVILHYDKEQKVLGLQPVHGDTETGAIKLSIKRTPAKDGNGIAISAFISAKSFLNYYRISYSETESYDATWDAGEGMLITFLAKSTAKNEPAAQG